MYFENNALVFEQNRVNSFIEISLLRSKTLSNLFIYLDTSYKNCYNKKADNVRWKLLAYPSFSYIRTMQNGKVDFEQFLVA